MIESDINTLVANFSNQLETELNDKIKNQTWKAIGAETLLNKLQLSVYFLS